VRQQVHPRKPCGTQDVVPVVVGDDDSLDLHVLLLAEGSNLLDLVGKQCRINERGMSCIVHDAGVHGISPTLRHPQVLRESLELQAHVIQPLPVEP